MLFFILFPVAPPRLVNADFMDTVARYSHAYRALQPPSLVNRYAAFPSLHFGWDLLIGIALVAYARSLWARALGVAMPVAMAMAVVLTANHWLVDVVAGAALSLIGLAVARGIASRDRPPPGWNGQTDGTYTAVLGHVDPPPSRPGHESGPPARPRASSR